MGEGNLKVGVGIKVTGYWVEIYELVDSFAYERCLCGYL